MKKKANTDSAFGEKAYADIDLDSLVTFAVWSIGQKGEQCTFERLVAECFALFPRKFSLFRYPQWPDSARVNKSWLRCRTDKGHITGSVKQGFHLTQMGLTVVQKTADLLQGRASKKPLAIPRKSRSVEEALVNRALQHAAYKRFAASPDGFLIAEDEFRHLLLVGRSATRHLLAANLATLREASRLARQDSLLRFISACEVQMSYLLKKGAMK